MNYTPPAQQGQALQGRDLMAAHRLNSKGWFCWINHTFSHFNLDTLGTAREGDGFRVRTLRLPADAGLPDLARSNDVAGYNQHGDALYLHLAGGAEAFVRLNPAPPPRHHLENANARLSA